MEEHEIFESVLRSTGDLAGVFEHDGETGYFYLYDVRNDEGEKIVDSIHIMSGQANVDKTEVAIRWDGTEQRVGLFIRDTLWAVFNATEGTKHGGNYRVGADPLIPPEEEILAE